ncbi:hypothetical protein EDC23_2129 [Thiohalophilus thiocyanatoxydans]|uniref:Uncharacterized protein n=1 Tax=Thiohalophilus thiocyanatoxydans TaxID=381308 RepID=A0A4V3H3U3_9GAMM|nr:hypothetical protein EDC23_2129 [Thiohalophilus thiocyanatoxydans]
MSKKVDVNALCGGCVYYPPNLPATAYSEADYRELQKKSCSYDHQPGDQNCQQTRKTHCSLFDLQDMQNRELSRSTS